MGESTSREFRLALAHESVREQDIIAVDAELRRTDDAAAVEKIRVWAKVQRIERVNPLFPHEAGHELAATQTHPLDTVLSLSREMVTAVCQILGSEPLAGTAGGRLDHLRYPAQPASSAYRPTSADIARVVLGDLQERQNRALDIATLSNRPDINVKVDGHAVVCRHLAILAMTGAGQELDGPTDYRGTGREELPDRDLRPPRRLHGPGGRPGSWESRQAVLCHLPRLRGGRRDRRVYHRHPRLSPLSGDVRSSSTRSSPLPPGS